MNKFFVVCCCNEWCSGPEKWGMVEKIPPEPMACPTCGWLALPSDKASFRPFCDEFEKFVDKVKNLTVE